MSTLKGVLSWLDEHLLFLITGFLLAFIPLYPKLPLFEAISGYIVRVRIEDFLVGVALIIWLIQLIRGKAKFGPNPLAKPIIVYLVIGVLSMLSAIFVIGTVPMEALHIGKMVLHFLRRVEYFSLFFVFFSAVKSLKQVKTYLIILVLTMLAITIYGYGQKYLYWPAYSTMNREFSKGWQLVLTQGARVMSTFGGHYDLAAFTMAILVFLWALFFSVKQRIWKLLVFIVLSGAFWLLILTVSRTSFLAYLAGVTMLFFFWMFRKGIRWAGTRWIGVILLSVLIMLMFGDLSDRFFKLLKLDQRIGGIKSLLTQPIGTPPSGKNIAFLENNPANIGDVTSKSDFPPLPARPFDITTETPDGLEATISASGAAILKEVPRTYSQNAKIYDLSTGIRLDALWPRAIAGFMRNPLLGSGYSTLTKTQVSEFTEAESTDNDYLRALGETGALGFLAFGGILAMILISIWKAFVRVKDPLIFSLLISMAAVVCALLVNAVYIDIFEASKVAFSFWALAGITLGAIKILPQEEKGHLALPKIPDLKDTVNDLKSLLKKIIASDKTYLLIILLIALMVRHYKIHAPLADWHSWRQADTSAVTRNFLRYGITPLVPRYDDLSSVASGQPNPEGYRFVEFPLYNLATVVVDKLFPGYNLEYSGRLTSIFASLGSLVFLYLITKKHLGVKTGLVAAAFFAILPYNIFWSRVILPEPTLVFLSLGMVYFFDRWTDKEHIWWWVLSVIFAAAALLVKFTVVFFAIPLLYLAWRKWGRTIITRPLLFVYAVVVVVPFGLWRIHIAQFPEGIPAYMWLLNGNGIRFKGAWFWWLYAERIAKLILGGWGIGLLIPGLAAKPSINHEKPNWFFHTWLLGMVAYLIVFATGNVQHDYYQIILVPILCIFLAVGSVALWENVKGQFHSLLAKAVVLLAVVFLLMFGWYQARDFFNINHPEIVAAGQEMQRVLGDKRGNTIAPYGGDTAFLYQTSQRGWPLMEGTIDEMIAKGAHYYISVNFDQLTQKLVNIAKAQKDPYHPFKLLKETEKFALIQLVPDNLLPHE